MNQDLAGALWILVSLAGAALLTYHAAGRGVRETLRGCRRAQRAPAPERIEWLFPLRGRWLRYLAMTPVLLFVLAPVFGMFFLLLWQSPAFVGWVIEGVRQSLR